MKQHIRKLLAFLLALVLSVQLGEVALATAAEEVRVALDPTSQIELSIPDDLSEGNWFFIRENQFEISEKSEEKLYVPIQRAGDLSEEASVTLKLADITSHFGVNYEAEIFRVKQDPVVELGQFSLVDAIHENQDTLAEVPEMTEEEMAELIAQQGEVDITDAAGNKLGTISAEAEEKDPAAEGGEQPAGEEKAKPAEGGEQPAGEGKKAAEAPSGQPAAEGEETPAGALTLIPEEVEPVAEEGAAPAEAEEPAVKNPLRAARDAFTGTVSDRQPMESSVSWMSPALQELYDKGDDSLPEVEQEEELPNSIPGYTFTLDFAAGERVKFLVITPLYSEKADGDSSLMLTLEEPVGGVLLHEDFFTSYVTITDADAPEPVVVSFSQAEYTAADGKAILTVTRTGAINEIVTVRVATYDGSALQGADYSGVGAKLYFSMGMESRTLEIPVGHGTKAKDFYVTITPVSACTAGLSTARVVIPAEEQEAELMVSDAFLGEPFTTISSMGGATINSTGGTFVSSDKRLETTGIRIENGWGRGSYFYDGVRLTWSADLPVFGFVGRLIFTANTMAPWGMSEPTNIVDIDTNTIASSFSNPSFDLHDDEYYFGKELNPHVYQIYMYRSMRSAFSSTASATVHNLTPIRRQFTFKVQPADKLGLRGIPEDDEKQINGVYVNSSLTDASVTVLSGGSFALTAQNSSEFCRFAGIDAILEDGSTYRIANATPGTRTINVTVSEEMINYLATHGGIEWSDNNGVHLGAKLGTIKIKPIFEKIPAKVQIDEGAYGYFEGFEGGGEYDYYLGERITLKTVLNERGQAARVRGSGIGYYKADGKEGVRLDQSNDSPYLNAAMTKVFQIDQPYTCIWPVFDTSGNAVTVQVRNEDLQYFDTSKGIFALDENPNYNPETDTWTYFVEDNATVNQVMLLVAPMQNGAAGIVPLWSDTRSSTQYSGTMFPIRVGTGRAENVVTLSVCTDFGQVFPCEVTGTVQAQEINLATGRPGGRLSPAKNALVYFGTNSALTDGRGAFTIPGSQVVSGTAVRYAVSYNGALTIAEMRAPVFDWLEEVEEVFEAVGSDVFFEEYFDLNSGWKKPVPADIGIVEIPSFSTLGAHIKDVYVIQDHHYTSDVKILEMNGQKTVLAARVSPGEGYMLDGETKQETIKGVTFYFQNPLTNALHGVFDAVYDKDTDTWRVDLGYFTPDRPDDYNYGDVLYVQLTTDKQVAAVYDATGEVAPLMCYDPVSTGFSVIADADYQPTYFDYNMPVDAASVFGPGGIIEQGGGDPELCDTPYDEALLQGSSTRTTYGEFPFIGELNFILYVAAAVSNSAHARAVVDTLATLGQDSDAELDSDDASLQGITDVIDSSIRIGIAMKFNSLPYGGTRFIFAVTFTGGNTLWSQFMSNPWQDTGAASRFFSGGTEYGGYNGLGFKRVPNGFFGPAMFSMTFVIGFYLDFGYLDITTTDGSGHSSVQNKCVYLGGGGLGGFIGNLSTTAPLTTPVPMYVGFEVDASIMFYLGAGKDPNLTLEAFKEDKSLDGLDFGFQYQLTGSVTGKGVLGLGFDHALGLRGNLGAKIELCYSPTFQKWFPNNSFFANRPFSYGSSLVMSGYLDAVFVNLPLASFSYPLFYRGYLWLFNQMRIANRVVKYVQSGVNSMLDKGTGDPTVIRRCTDLCDRILAKLERFENPKTEADELREYAYQNGVINAAEYATSFSAEIGGLLGTAIKLMDDEGDETPAWSVQPHVDSTWVAEDSAELMAAFSPVSSTDIVKNSREQANARLMDIGNNQLLLVFLGDDPARSEAQASVLKYAVYNTATGKWTVKPTVVQDDGTGDYMPDLCDAEGDVILTWVSTAPNKVIASTEDPTQHLEKLDVFSVRFNKASLSFGAIDQLTDDNVYDSMPRAVYDDESHDVLVLYTKTRPDTDYAPGSVTQKLLDYTVGGVQMYSVNAYMLYNGTQEPDDPHAVGWARDYFYDNESDFDETEKDKEAAFLRQWGGQRFIRIEIDDQSDPAISDMVVSRGYNGLAVYAYTVNKNPDLSSSGDNELYIQFYDFRTHSTYVPIRLTNDGVVQSMPALTRSGGDTYLFWLEDSKELKYVDVSSMLKSKVYYIDQDTALTVPAVKPDGSFDAGYTPPICSVDMTSMTNEDGVEGLTSFTVLTNETTINGETYEDLYVIWTSGETYEVPLNISTGETRTETCKEIYASALIHEEDRTLGEKSLEASWSKPYRLTEDHKYHDGVTAAVSSSGDLYLVHNEFDMIWHGDDADWLSTHMTAGVDQKTGRTYYEGDCYEYTQTDLVMTRCEPVGSLEVTHLNVSDETPMPGGTVKVTAVVENTGLTTARGCDVTFYETRNGQRGRAIHTVGSNDKIVVNTGVTCSFDWRLPSNLSGVGIECVVTERNNPKGGSFSPISKAYSPFQVKAELTGEIQSITQNGDVFEAKIAVKNSGNAAAEQGTVAKLHLECLYGNAKELYGVDDQTLATVSLSGLAAGRELTRSVTLNIPASVFEYCSYDALTLRLFSPEGVVLEESEQCFVSLDEPMGLKLGDGSSKRMKIGQTAPLDVSYELSSFLDKNTSVAYTTEDPSVAMVVNGELFAVGNGTTSLTATVLPYGTSTSVKVIVSDQTDQGNQGGYVPAPVNNGTTPPANADAAVTVTEARTDSAIAAQSDGTVVVDLRSEGEAVGTAQFSAAQVQKLADATSAENGAERVEIALPGGTVKLDSDTLKALAETDKAISVTAKDNGTGTVTVDVTVDGKSVDADVKVALPAVGDGQVLVIVKPDGTEEIVKKSIVEDGTVYAEIPAGSTVMLADRAKTFSDVAEGAWYEGAVDFVSSHGLFQGTEKGFEPNLTMNRAMLATVLYRLEGAEPTGTNSFDDVSDDAWYADAVTWASNAGIVTGTGSGFDPEAPVTREQIAVMLYRYANYLKLDTGARTPLNDFRDGGKTSPWAKDAMQWAISAGLFQGNADGSLNPAGKATRAEVATLLQRMEKLIVM